MSSKPLSRKHVEEYDSDDGFVEDGRKSKKQKSEPKPLSKDVQKDEEGNEYWELSGKRRITISSFKGTMMVSLREYYEKDGKTLPGKKGISMTAEQYSAFLELIPDVERVLHSKGIDVPRPQFDGSAQTNEAADGEEPAGNEDDDGNGQQEGKRSRKPKSKRNHDATSDEDEE